MHGRAKYVICRTITLTLPHWTRLYGKLPLKLIWYWILMQGFSLLRMYFLQLLMFVWQCSFHAFTFPLKFSKSDQKRLRYNLAKPACNVMSHYCLFSFWTEAGMAMDMNAWSMVLVEKPFWFQLKPVGGEHEGKLKHYHAIFFKSYQAPCTRTILISVKIKEVI